jgi:hypothetical protein
MRERFVSHDHVRPDRFDELFLGDHAAGVFDQKAQDFEGFRAQFDHAIRRPQGAARSV